MPPSFYCLGAFFLLCCIVWLCEMKILVVKNLPANARDVRCEIDLGLAASPGGGNGSPLQYSCLETPMDGGAWRDAIATVLNRDVTVNTRIQ